MRLNCAGHKKIASVFEERAASRAKLPYIVVVSCCKIAEKWSPGMYAGADTMQIQFHLQYRRLKFNFTGFPM